MVSPAAQPDPTGQLRKESGRGAGFESKRGGEAVHDFAGKLQQPGMWPYVVDYVRWQRARRSASEAGGAEPAAPDLAPLSINLDLTTACNYACDHCIDWDILNSKVRHDDEALRASLRQMAERGLKSVILIGGGEPTLYPGFASMVAFLKQELRLQVAIVSNGSRGERLLQVAPFLERGDWVRLSLDSGSNDVFRRMHKPSRQSLTLDEICSWVPRIKQQNATFDFGFSFVITWQGSSRGGDDASVQVIENLHEIEAAAERASRSGFDYISYKPFLVRTEAGSEVLDPTQLADSQQQVIDRIQQGIARARRFERAGFRVLESTNLRVFMQGRWQDYTRQPRTCHMQMLRQVVTPLGAFNCPAHRGVDKARLGEGALWQDSGEGMRQTARLLDGFDAAVECAEVTCLYHGTNWWLEQLIASSQDLPADAPVADRADHFL